MKGASEGKQDFYELLIDWTLETDKYPRWATEDGDFRRRDMQEVLKDVEIDPYEIIGGIDYIIEETTGVYSGDPECIQIMKAVITLVENYERTGPKDEPTRKVLDYAYKKLKKLKKEYPGCMPEWEEDTSIIIPSKLNLGVQDLPLQSSRLLSHNFGPDTELLGQIDDLKNEINQLAQENAILKQQLEDKEPEKAFNATGNGCFTKAKMGLLIYTIASLKDGPTPIKARLVSIISAIGGWESTSVGAEMKKAGFNQNDIDAVAKLFEDVMPNFASEIKKQIPRRTNTKK